MPNTMGDVSCPDSPEFPLLSSSIRWNKNSNLKAFIEKYETLPELWDTASPAYTNKYKRHCALIELLAIYKEINPNADIVDVKKKINTLRTNCRKELNKIKSSKSTGSGTDEIYKPTSWIFYALTFLHKTECPAILMDLKDQLEDSFVACEEDNNEYSPAPTVSISSMAPKQPPSKKKKAMGPISKQLLQLACDYMSSDSTNSADDECLNIGKVWGIKLKKLPLMQRKLAEKSINDILFEADMGKLHTGSVRINQQDTVPRIFPHPQQDGHTMLDTSSIDHEVQSPPQMQQTKMQEDIT